MSGQKGSAEARRAARQAAFDPKTRHPWAFAIALAGMAIGLGTFLTPVVFVGLTRSLVEALEIVGLTLLAAGLVTLVAASGALHPWRQAVEYSRVMAGAPGLEFTGPAAKCANCGNMNPDARARCSRCGSNL
jgi:hypothetical protein